MFHLRPYQEDIIEQVRANFKSGNKSVLIQLATGGGKTALTANMLSLATRKDKVCWFIVHRRELIKQTMNAFSTIGMKNYGVVSSGFIHSKAHPIQICSVQTLINRFKIMPPPDLIAWDECHHCSAGSYSKIYNHFPKAFHIGLSATPQRLDGTGLIKYFKTMVNGPSMESLINDGYLSNYEIYAPGGMNTSNVHIKMGDFVKSELNKIADRPSITGDAIKHYLKLANGKRAVVFCVSVEHSKHVVQNFRQAGISAEHVDGETPTEERDIAIRRFKDGEIKVLSNVELFGEGFDLPAIEAAILLRPTNSLGLYLQQVGRALRMSEGKERAIILDHAGNCERHGLPDEDRVWNLEGQEKRKGDKPVSSVKVCPQCFAAQRVGLQSCSYCGYLFEKQSREVAHVEGDLVKVDPAVLRRKRLIDQGKCQTKEELVQEGKRRGFKHPERWAHYVWKAREEKRMRGAA